LKQKRGITKKAVALSYEPLKDSAPRITAKGRGHIAEKIIRIAKENGVPIQSNVHLVEVLSQIDLYEEIPECVYQIVAEIFTFVYSLQHEAKRQHT
jgi:flagellar biosynthesis protein